MSATLHGGNVVSRARLDERGRRVFCEDPYVFFHQTALPGEVVDLGGLRSVSVFCLAAGPRSGVVVPGVERPLEAGDCAQVEDREGRLGLVGGPVQVLVAGTPEPNPSRRGVAVTRSADHYRVEKPWGWELWLNGQHPTYTLKQIFVRAGTRTSLQYHRRKRETNVLLKGAARLHFKAEAGVPNDAVTPRDLATVALSPVSIVDIAPGVLHRLEAVTDLLLCEASTPHPDDVVRVHDDSGRPDGRVSAEHPR